jgi:predicted transcriptional regulator
MTDMLAYTLKRTTVKIPNELDARLRQEAARTGLTISEVTRAALSAYLGAPTPGQRRVLLATAAGRSGRSDLAQNIEEILAGELL